jgi:hypothetical protein
MLPPLKPIPIKERMSVVFVERGEIDVVDGAFVVVDQQGLRVRAVLTHIPVGGVACIMLEPGTLISHRAAALAEVFVSLSPESLAILATRTNASNSFASSSEVKRTTTSPSLIFLPSEIEGH